MCRRCSQGSCGCLVNRRQGCVDYSWFEVHEIGVRMQGQVFVGGFRPVMIRSRFQQKISTESGQSDGLKVQMESTSSNAVHRCTESTRADLSILSGCFSFMNVTMPALRCSRGSNTQIMVVGDSGSWMTMMVRTCQQIMHSMEAGKFFRESSPQHHPSLLERCREPRVDSCPGFQIRHQSGLLRSQNSIPPCSKHT